jgi:ferredoxin
MSDEENDLLADNGADDDERLSCQTQILGDVVVWFDGS